MRVKNDPRKVANNQRTVKKQDCMFWVCIPDEVQNGCFKAGITASSCCDKKYFIILI